MSLVVCLFGGAHGSGSPASPRLMTRALHRQFLLPRMKHKSWRTISVAEDEAQIVAYHICMELLKARRSRSRSRYCGRLDRSPRLGKIVTDPVPISCSRHRSSDDASQNHHPLLASDFIIKDGWSTQLVVGNHIVETVEELPILTARFIFGVLLLLRTGIKK